MDFPSLNQNKHWHAFWIFGISILFSALAVLPLLAQPKVLESTYVFENGQSGAFNELPLNVADVPWWQNYHVTLNLDLSRNHLTRYFIAPDDCLARLVVNGQDVHNKSIPFCALNSGHSFNLSKYLHTGQNVVEMDMFNQAYGTGVMVRAKAGATEYLLILILAFAFSWFAWPYVYPHSSRNFMLRLHTKDPRLHRRVIRIAKNALIFILCVLCVVAVWKLWHRLLFEISGPFNSDSPLYWAVGKGILNGLVPYRDLFETKPPGIFLISAFSYWVTGGPSIGYAVQTLTILGFPLLLLSFVLRKDNKAGKMRTVILVALSLVFGILFSLFAAQLSGTYQVESIGAFFGALYIWILVMSPQRFSGSRTLLAAACILFAIGLKEPFLLTVAAACLLVIRSWEDFIRRFLIPLGIAAVAGFIIMLLLGYLGPYIRIYLPEMLGRHIHMSNSSFLERGFHVHRIWVEMERYSVFLSWSLVTLLASYVVARSHGRANLKHVCSVIFMSAIALYLLTLAVGMGGQFAGHHFVFALPVFFALFVAFVQHAKCDWGSVPINIIVTVLTICGALSLLMLPLQSNDMTGYRAEIQQQQKLASAIDDVLDRCEEERYLFLGMNGLHPFAYTEHSPLGPTFFQYDYLLGNNRKHFRDSFLKNLDKANVVVIHSFALNEVRDLTINHLDQNFTDRPWPCAEGVVLSDIDSRYRMVFRVNSL